MKKIWPGGFKPGTKVFDMAGRAGWIQPHNIENQVNKEDTTPRQEMVPVRFDGKDTGDIRWMHFNELTRAQQHGLDR